MCCFVPKVCGMVPKMYAIVPKMCGMVPKMCGMVPKMYGIVPKMCGMVHWMTNIKILFFLFQIWHQQSNYYHWFFSLDFSLPRFFLVSVSNRITISHVTTFWDQLYFCLIFRLKIISQRWNNFFSMV